MVSLLIKEHNTTGLKYFCKTTKKDIHKYMGSGKYWKAHIKKYGNDVKTILFGEFKEKDKRLTETALKFSEDNNIVNKLNEDGKKVWANLIPENGLDGAPIGNIHSEETKEKIGLKSKARLSTRKDKSLEEFYGKEKASKIISKMKNSKYHSADTFEERFGKDKAKEIKLKISRPGEQNSNASKWKLISPGGEIFESFGNIDEVIKSKNLAISTIKSFINKGKIEMKNKKNKHNEWEIIKT